MRHVSVCLLIALVLTACSFSEKTISKPQEVLGVTLGGSLEELKEAYIERKLSLTKTTGGGYGSSDALQPVGAIKIKRVEYQFSSGVLDSIELTFDRSAASDIEKFIDREYSYDSVKRREFEDRLRFVGNIGDDDHVWFLESMGVVLRAEKNEILLIYSLK